MAKLYPDVLSFIGGLLSPTLEGRVDYAKYGVGCRVLENFIVSPTGGIYKRPGLRFVAPAKQSEVRLIPFDFNGTERQSYVLELGNTGYVRFFSQQGQVVDGQGNPLELSVPELAGQDLSLLSYVQSADLIYFAHPQMRPWALMRNSATSWARDLLTFLQSPDWPLPWGPNNYPGKVRIYEDRLIYAASPQQPLHIWMSKASDYESMEINTSADPTVDAPLPEDSIWLRIGGSRVNPIKWLLDVEQLVVGTNAAEYRIQGADFDAPLTPDTAGYRRQSSYGSNDTQAVMLGSSAMFCSRTSVDLYTLDYQDFGYRFKSSALNILCPEATQPAVIEMHSMNEPEPVAWCILSDGTFSGCTYIRDQEIFAWHRHNTRGKVISGAIIPYTQGDQFWMAVQRNGQTFIEFLETPFSYDSPNAVQNVFMDGHLSGTVVTSGKLSGLGLLAGQKVQVVSDGSYVGELEVDDTGTVSDSRIRAGDYAVAGYGYTAEVQPMRPNYVMPAMSNSPGRGQSINFKKRIVDIVLHVLGSIRGEARAEYEQKVPDFSEGEAGEWQEIVAFPHGAFSGSPPPCHTETIIVPVSGNSTYDGLVRIRQADPFPLYLTAMAYGIDQGMGV